MLHVYMMLIIDLRYFTFVFTNITCKTNVNEEEYKITV